MIVISAIVWGRKTGREDAEKDEKAKEERSSRWDRITGLFGLFFAIFIIIQTVPLGIGGIHEPGAGFFPCFAGTVLAVLSTALVVRAQVTLRTKKVVIREDRSKRRWTVVYIYIAFIVYALIFERLGFIPSTFLLIIFLFKMLERKKWWSALVTAALVVLSAHAVFNYLLNCELPNGILDVFF
jgi:putative tricarboxylic transport membrane protein